MRFLCLGAGAVGGYFGGRLIEAGEDVTFVVREARRRNLAEHGLRIQSKIGDLATQVTAVTSSDIDGSFDAILLACKAYDLPAAMEDVSAGVGANTVIVPLLNGVGHIETLNARFGRSRVLGGVAKIASTVAPDGTIVHLNDWRYLIFGEQNGVLTPRVLAIKQAFDKSSVVATAATDIMQAMWEKLVHLTTIAGMTSMMRANVGEIARTQDGVSLATRFLTLNAEIAAAEGHPPSSEFMEEYRQYFSNRKSANTASMLRDIEGSGRVEADHIIGFMLDRAVAHGIDPLFHQLVYTHLKSYEERRAADRLS